MVVDKHRTRELCVLQVRVKGRATCGAGTNELGAGSAALARERGAHIVHLHEENTASKGLCAEPES